MGNSDCGASRPLSFFMGGRVALTAPLQATPEAGFMLFARGADATASNGDCVVPGVQLCFAEGQRWRGM
jgi:hypothetical protein